MASANTTPKIAELDFASIKNNFISYLRSQDTFKDYNFSGSALSTLLDVLTYNTQYNAYYLNMVANEMFLDSALQRSSAVSHAKMLNYTPRSTISSTASANVTINGVSSTTLTLPRYSTFISNSIDGKNYTFVNIDEYTTPVSANTALFTNVELREGIATTLTFNYSASSNPKSTFQIPNKDVDTTTLLVKVFDSSTSTSFEIYNPVSNYLSLTSTSRVYFLTEDINEYYNVSFGDGILGAALPDGAIVSLTYLTSKGSLSNGAKTFALTSSVGGTSSVVTTIDVSTGGKEKETLDSIKYQAPKTFSAQGRAVSKEDYISIIQQNTLGLTFDAVNVWGGEQNDPPVYGQVFIALKPQGAYTLTQTQKERLINDVIKPVSVITVQPQIVEPDYTYIQVYSNVIYDPKKTTLTPSQLQALVKSTIQAFGKRTLNTFNSTFNSAALSNEITNADPSITANEITIRLQKKFLPNLSIAETYKLYFNVALERGVVLSGVTSYPSLSFINPQNALTTINNVYLDELASSTGGISSVLVTNPGYGYQKTPTVNILGDGMGAKATAVLTPGGAIRSINITNAGTGYTSALVEIISADTDTTGQLGAAVAILDGQYGTIRSYYNNNKNVKTILNSKQGSIDYINGIITLDAFNPVDIDNELGLLTVSVVPDSTLISSQYNRIITIDEFDSQAINVTVTAKK